MDLYGLNEARSQGNARTQSNDLFNEQIRVARDNINNTLDSEKIQAQGNLRDQKERDLQDKIIYDIHDTIGGANLINSLSRISESVNAYNKAKASGLSGGIGTFLSSQQAVRRGDVDKVFGSATAVADKVADATTNTVKQTRVSSLPQSLGATQTQTAQPLTEAQQSSFLDESARVMGADARPASSATTEVNNRPKTNEPASANENTPEIPEGGVKLNPTDELSSGILSATEKVKKGAGFASLGLRAVGDVGGAIGTYEMFKNGFAKNKDGTVDKWNEVSQIAGTVGTGLDIIGAFIPALEPVGQLAQAIGAVADTIDSHNNDAQATKESQNEVDNVETQRKAQLNALPQAKPQSAPVNSMVSGGLVGTASQHINNATQGTGTF